MRPRRRLSLLPWTAAANAVALLLLFGAARHLAPRQATEEQRPAAELVAPAPSDQPPPDQVIIRQQRLHRVPGPVIAPPRMPRQPWPWMTPLPAPRSGSFSLSTPRDALREALDVALRSGEGWLSEHGRGLRVILPREGAALPDASGGVLIAAADDAAPPAAAGWRALSDDDALWHRPHDVRAWRRSVAMPAAWLRADDRVVWLPAAVRAGWLAGRPEALRLLRNALADRRLSGP